MNKDTRKTIVNLLSRIDEMQAAFDEWTQGKMKDMDATLRLAGKIGAVEGQGGILKIYMDYEVEQPPAPESMPQPVTDFLNSSYDVVEEVLNNHEI